MKRTCLFATAIFVLFACQAHAQEDRCKDILANGVWEYSFNESDVHNVSSFLNWYKSVNSESSSVSKKQSLEAGTIYDGAPIKLGLSNDQKKNDEFFSQIDKLNSGYEEYNSSVVNFVKTASSVIAQAWSDCMKSARIPGIHASLKFTSDPRDLLLNLQFQPIDQRQRVNVKVGVGRGVQCDVGNNQTVTVPSNVSTVVRCARTDGSAGAIILSSEVLVIPENSVLYSSIKYPRTGAYATCAIVEEIMNGHDTLGPSEEISTGGRDISGGKPVSTALHLEVPPGYRLGDVQKHCRKNAGDRPCAFVIPLAEAPWSWTIPDRSMDWNPSNNSDSVTVWITGSKSKIVPGFDRRPNGSVTIFYSKAFSVEFPNTALDVKLQCQATSGDHRIYSLSAVETQGDQVYVKGIRQSVTGRVIDMAVAPFDVSP